MATSGYYGGSGRKTNGAAQSEYYRAGRDHPGSYNPAFGWTVYFRHGAEYGGMARRQPEREAGTARDDAFCGNAECRQYAVYGKPAEREGDGCIYSRKRRGVPLGAILCFPWFPFCGDCGAG